MDLISRIKQNFHDSINTKQLAADLLAEPLATAAQMITQCLLGGGKVLSIGNGGSAGDAQHFSSEMLNRFEMERPGLPAIALTTDSSIITSIGNDESFDRIFAKQVEALGRAGDVAWGLSTSGRSANILAALRTARQRDMHGLGMAGRGGLLEEETDLLLTVPSDITARVQEAHITLGHILCGLVEEFLETGS